MILNKNRSENNTDSTTQNNGLMLKMVTSYSIFLLIILGFIFIIYNFTLNNMRNQYNAQNKATLMSNVELFEKDIDIMEVYCRQLLQDNTFHTLMSYNTPYQNSYKDFLAVGSKVKTSLATNVYPESLLPISDVFIFLNRTQYILSPNNFTEVSRFYSGIKGYPTPQYESWLEALTNSDYMYQFLPMNVYMPNSSKDFYMYVIDLNDLYYRTADAAVCFVIDGTELQELFDCVQENNTKHSFLIAADSDGYPILTINNNTQLTLNDIHILDFESGFSSLRQGGDLLTVGKYFSEDTENVYYFGFPSFDNSSNAFAAYQIIFIVLFLITLLSGGFLVFFFSRRNVRPIVELGQELHEAVEAQNYLQEVVDSQRPIICSSYIRQLMSGTVTSEEEVSYIKDFLGLIGDPLYYNVLYIVVYNNSGSSQESLPHGINTAEEFNRVVTEALSEYFGLPLYCYNPADRTYALLMACTGEDEPSFILKMQETILHLHDLLLDTYGIWLFAGVGRNTDNLMNVWEAYQQAVEAVSYTTKNYIFFPYEFIKKDSNVFYYPPEISTKLIHFITTGNTPQVLELFGLIHQENIEERSLPINLLKFLLSDIRNTLLKARFALPGNVDKETAAALDERFNEHLSFGLCEDLALALCRLFSNGTEDDSLAVTIEKYILANYKDPSLGLNKISDEFQISESYFSHMFKEKTGVNFSNYLENIRMSEAARLIKETGISMNELYIEVGYNNPTTFRRAFKKTFGMTPSGMRDASST